MAKIIAFGASTSTSSINKQLASYALSLTKESDSELLDLNDFEVPLYSEDKEKEIGSPEGAKNFLGKLNEADAFIISMAEHNGNFSAAFKNLYDWVSRIEKSIFNNKKILLLSSSPGPGGAANSLNIAQSAFPFAGAQISTTFSLPSFYDHFADNHITDHSLDEELRSKVQVFLSELA